MSETRTREFGWQRIRLRIPDDWELGRVDGDAKSGYARLDDAEMVRAEVEWRNAPGRGARRPLSELVDRYLENLEKKADKAGIDFQVERRAGFLGDTEWLEGSEHEAFVWEADYRAYNLARACPDCHRIVLARVLTKVGEKAGEQVNRVLRSLEDHPREEDGDGSIWCVYGMRFRTPPGYELSEHDLKSGHIKLTFEKDGGARTLRVHRLSMAQMLLRERDLADWFPDFFRKDLRDVRHDVSTCTWRGHEGLRVTGVPRSRWRQILKPLPMVNPRPRRYLDGGVWHCPEQNRVCVVECLTKRRQDAGDGTLEELIEGYVATRNKPRLTREAMLSSRPARNEALEWTETDAGEARITVRRQENWKTKLLSKVFYIPEERNITLDEVGTKVWHMCDGKTSVGTMIDSLRDTYKLDRKEAEVSLLSYLKTLGQKHFVGFLVDRPEGGGRGPSGGKSASGKKWKR